MALAIWVGETSVSDMAGGNDSGWQVVEYDLEMGHK